MKLLIAIGIFVLAVFAAAGVVLQCALFLAFACDSHGADAKVPKWKGKVLVAVVATPLIVGIFFPPILYFAGYDWGLIHRVAFWAFGLPLIFVMVIVCRIVEKK